MIPGEELLFCALGGSGEIGMNVNLYGTQGRWLMVDLGLTFADPDYPGIDLILPDLEFIESRRDALAGIVLTHGHEDHIGAIPYLADHLKAPLYATPFTAGLIAEKLEEEGLTGRVKLNVVARDASFDAGPFKLTYVALAHSIPEGNGLLIESPHGRVFHTGDWKIDETPVLGEPSSHDALEQVGEKGILALTCDSTNVFLNEPSGSEAGVHEGLRREVEKARGRVVVTTFASNAARLQTLGRVANETGRRVCMAGRSLDRIVRVAKSTGYLQDFPEPVGFDEAMRLPKKEVLIMATGGQGEQRAALGRIAFGNHDIKLTEGDTVIFSSKIIPGNEAAIGRIMNALVGSRRDHRYRPPGACARVRASGPPRARADVRLDPSGDHRARSRRGAAHGGAGPFRTGAWRAEGGAAEEWRPRPASAQWAGEADRGARRPPGARRRRDPSGGRLDDHRAPANELHRPDHRGARRSVPMASWPVRRSSARSAFRSRRIATTSSPTRRTRRSVPSTRHWRRISCARRFGWRFVAVQRRGPARNRSSR